MVNCGETNESDASGGGTEFVTCVMSSMLMSQSLFGMIHRGLWQGVATSIAISPPSSARAVPYTAFPVRTRSSAMSALPFCAPSVAVVGGGLTGAVVAFLLAKQQFRVTLYDKGRAPGGRLSSRTFTLDQSTHQAQFDYGAQFIGQPQTEAFASLLDEWKRAGLVEAWEGAAGTLDTVTGSFTPTAADQQGGSSSSSAVGLPTPHHDSGTALAAVPSMASLPRQLLALHPNNITVRSRTNVSDLHIVATTTAAADGSSSPSLAWQLRGTEGRSTETVDLGTFHSVVVTDSLAARLKPSASGHITIHPFPSTSSPADPASILIPAAHHLFTSSLDAMQSLTNMKQVPVFTLMAAWSQIPASPAPHASPKTQSKGVQGSNPKLFGFSRAWVKGSSHLSWISEDSTKPGRPASCPALVALTTPEYALELMGGDAQAESLPSQTPEYLTQRAQHMWEDIQPELTRARGGVPLPAPTHLSIHRWGSAASDPPLGVPCISVTQPPLTHGPSATDARAEVGASTADGVEGRLQTACLVLAGDFCLGPGIENAALSGLAAAKAVKEAVRAAGG